MSLLLMLGSRAAIPRNVSGRGAFPSAARNQANASNYTQFQQKTAFEPMVAADGLSVTWGNYYGAGPAGTAFSGPSAITIRAAMTDGTTSYPLYWPNGSRDITLAPGDVASTAPLACPMAAGKRLWLIYLVTMAAAWANLPGATLPAWSTGEGSELGNSLADRTLTNWTPGGRVSNWTLFPPLAITARPVTPRKVVAVLGDSISSDSANDTSVPYYNQGWAALGLAAAGIPFVLLGESSLQAQQVASLAIQRRDRFAGLAAAGVTHILCPLGTNDWANGRTNAQLLADHQTIAADAAARGITYIPTTLQPRTNAANNTYYGTETNTWARRTAFNAAIRAGNGLGAGYYDLAAVTEVGATSLWRTDALNIAAGGVALTAGGTGYTANDYLWLPGGALLKVQTVAAGVITAMSGTIWHAGGYTAAPSPGVAQTGGWRADGTTMVGTGATFTLTTQSIAPSTDGIHPAPAIHKLIAADFMVAAATLFA